MVDGQVTTRMAETTWMSDELYEHTRRSRDLPDWPPSFPGQPGTGNAAQDGLTPTDNATMPLPVCTYVAAETDSSRSQMAAFPAARRTPPVLSWALFPWVSLTLCMILWLVALNSVNVAGVATAGLGLVSVLPVTFWAAVGLLMVSFCWTVTRRSSRWPVLAAHTVALVTVLHATPAILYGTLRYSWAWKHIGIVDFISHNGVVFNLGGILGPYQGWPGFFSLNSFLTSASGLNSSLSYASWVLPFNDLIWLGPVLLIARAFSSDKRLIWTAAWIFTLGNWIGQDYFSPQAFAYFLYLTVVAICVRWLREPQSTSPEDLPGSARPSRYTLTLCLLPLMVAVASTHQLTPFMLITALGVLAVFNQLQPRVLLPVAMTVISLGWLAYGARDWLAANYSQLLQGFGLPWANASAHLVGQGAVPSDQILIDWAARSLSGAVGVLAIIGFWRYRRHHDDPRVRRAWFRVALLAVAAIPALAANNYGGEIIFRVYLFAIPFMAIAAAAAFFPHLLRGRSIWTALVLAVTFMLLLTGFSLGNFGQESVNYFSPQEVAASEWLYQTAPRGAVIVGADSNFPWAFVHYDWYSYTFLDSTPGISTTGVLRDPVGTVVSVMKHKSPPAAYLILTRSQATEITMTGTWPASTYNRLTKDVLTSRTFRIAYRNSDALIFQLVEAPRQASARTAPGKY